MSHKKTGNESSLEFNKKCRREIEAVQWLQSPFRVLTDFFICVFDKELFFSGSHGDFFEAFGNHQNSGIRSSEKHCSRKRVL